MNHLDYCDELDLEVERFADALATANFEARVPSCPEWNVRDLTEHLGTVHRWAEQLVHARATAPIPLAGMDIGESEASDEWLRAGGRTLSATLRAANPDQAMWAWGADQHVRFWSRRQLHETLVHRIDLELAIGVTSRVEPAIAVDAIDEFFANLSSDRDIAITSRPSHPSGERLQFRAKRGLGEWSVELRPDGYSFVGEGGWFDAVVTGEPAEMLALVLRRRPLKECDVSVQGDVPLVEYWLGGTAFL
jgi:uncharacterized protein (TIGR03083 family)